MCESKRRQVLFLLGICVSSTLPACTSNPRPLLVSRLECEGGTLELAVPGPWHFEGERVPVTTRLARGAGSVRAHLELGDERRMEVTVPGTLEVTWTYAGTYGLRLIAPGCSEASALFLDVVPRRCGPLLGGCGTERFCLRDPHASSGLCFARVEALALCGKSPLVGCEALTANEPPRTPAPK